MSENKNDKQEIWVFPYSHIQDGNKIGQARIWVTAETEAQAAKNALHFATQRGHKNIRLGGGKRWG